MRFAPSPPLPPTASELESRVPMPPPEQVSKHSFQCSKVPPPAPLPPPPPSPTTANEQNMQTSLPESKLSFKYSAVPPSPSPPPPAMLTSKSSFLSLSQTAKPSAHYTVVPPSPPPPPPASRTDKQSISSFSLAPNTSLKYASVPPSPPPPPPPPPAMHNCKARDPTPSSPRSTEASNEKWSPPMSTPQMKALILGETGSGKSTIGNSLLGHAVFESGPSDGGGLTTGKQSIVVDGVEYIDIPGYNDANKENIRVASEVVSDILKEKDSIVVAFVIQNVVPWRLKNTDAFAMNSFVNAIKHLNDHNIQFGVIMNKVDDDFVEQWEESNTACMNFKATLLELGCSDFLLIKKRRGMNKERNVMLADDVSNEIKRFILALPRNTTGEKAGAIAFDDEEELREVEEKLERIQTKIIQMQATTPAYDSGPSGPDPTAGDCCCSIS